LSEQTRCRDETRATEPTAAMNRYVAVLDTLSENGVDERRKRFV
jgi:hypothetical protein